MDLRNATQDEAPIIWEILQEAIAQRKQDGSTQWQNGYPNERTVQNDLANGHAYVLVDAQEIVAYAAILFGEEPTYNHIQGQWLTNGDYATVHRVATTGKMKGKGIATYLFKLIEELTLNHGVYSIKVDTNFDNTPMLRILDKLGYTYCGEISVDGSPRRAFEKVLLGL